MKRKRCTLLLLLALCLALSACSGREEANNKADTEIDAASVSGKIVPPSYSLVENERESKIWASDALTVLDGKVYYIGSDSEAYHLCCYDGEAARETVLFSSREKSFWDVAASPEGVLFLLAASDAGEYEIIQLGQNGTVHKRLK